jgi:hypothetical protein
MLCKQGDNIFISKPNMPSCCQSYARQQGDNTIIIYQSCHAIAKQDYSHYMNNLDPVLFESMTVTFMDIRPSAAIAFPASETKI